MVCLSIRALRASNSQALKSVPFKVVKTNPSLNLCRKGTSSWPGLMGSRCAVRPAAAEAATVAAAVTLPGWLEVQAGQTFQPDPPACEE